MSDAEIRLHMEIIASDGGHVGRVDRVFDHGIRAARFDFGRGYEQHMIPPYWVARVDDAVHLNVSRDEAVSTFKRQSAHV